jgi:hypothetical protein
VDARPVLGLSEMRPPFLVNVLDARGAQARSGRRASFIKAVLTAMPPLELDDEDDDDLDEDEDFDEDDEDSENDDDEAPDDDGETWQVSGRSRLSFDRPPDSAKAQPSLDFRALYCLD